jgi:hypothetical protein
MKSKRRTIIFLLFILLNFNISDLPVSAQKVGETKIYKGMCDASAAVALDENTFIVANDEDNDLRIFDKSNPVELRRIKLSEIFPGKISDGNNLEIDLEGATWVGDKIFWIGSHSASKNGKARPSRHRLFAVKISNNDTGKFNVVSAGKIYTDLISDLEKDARFKDFKLKEARNIKPKDIGGLSIEALAATPEGHLFIGFRNPLLGGKTSSEKILTNGKSLIVELLNPLEVIDGKPAKFAAPVVLDLDGLGIRGMEYDKSQKRYVIIAGPYFDKQEVIPQNTKFSELRLYLWAGKISEKPEYQQKVNLSGFNAETVFFYPQIKKGFMEIFSDDGKAICSDGFRSLQIQVK